MKPLTLQEACNILGIDNATLYRWLQRANIKPETDVHDRRRHTIAHAQLTHLARLHHRMLPEKTRQAIQSDIEALRPSQVEEAISETEERIEALESRINAIESLVSDREALQRIEASENNMRDLLSQMERVERLLIEHIASHTPAPQLKVLRPAPAPYDASGALPDGLVALRDFYTMHHVPETTAKRAAATGALPTVQGRWKRGRTFITHALDTSGRAAFYQRYHAEPYFTLCPECPHESPSQ